MMLELMRRDYCLRFLGRWLILGPITTLSILGVVAAARLAARGAGAEPGLLDMFLTVCVLWFPAAVYLGVAAIDRRLSRFDMALPVSSRRLWTAHTLTLALSTLAIVAVTIGVTAALRELVVRRAQALAVLFVPGIVIPALAVGASMLLAAAALQAYRPGLARLPRRRATAGVVIGVLAASLVISMALAAFAPWGSIVVLAAAAVVALLTARGLPGAFVASPRAPAPARPRGARISLGGNARPAGTGGVGWLLFSTIYRATTKMPLAMILGIPILLIFGLLLSGILRAARGGEITRFLSVILTSYILLAFSAVPPRKLYLLDALPLSRRTILAAVMLPLVAALAVGYGVGRIVADDLEAQRDHVVLFESDCCVRIRVPIEAFEIAWDGQPRWNGSPSGELHEAWTTYPYRGSRVFLHSPFSVTDGSSPNFVAFQASRAVQAIYGEHIPPREIRERYLATNADGHVVFKSGGASLLDDYPHLRPLPAGPAFPVLMLLVLGVWLAAYALYLRTLRAGISERTRKGVYWGLMLGLLVVHTSQFVLAATGRIDLLAAGGFCEILVRDLAEALPGGAFTIWVVSALAVFGVYKAAERQFLKVESMPGDEQAMELIPLLAWGARSDDATT